MPNLSAAYGNTVAGPTLGNGAHTIGLYLAEDSYAGDVQVTISVNGVQLGGVQAVSALQSNGASELFTLRGDWSGTPTVSVNFLNDTWDGRTGQGHDRNLYVNHVTYDGVAAAADPRVALWSGPVYVSTRPILRASDFINTIGVTAHLLYADTSYNNESMVLATLNYLGISHVRDGGDVRDPSALAPFERLMAQGISFDFGTLAILDIPTEIARINTLLAAVPGKIASIEGMNEAAANFSYGGKTGQAAALQLQQDLYTAVKADPALAGIPVLNYTLLSQDPADYTRYGDVSASADLGNVHMYPSGGLTNLASTLLPRELENTAGSSGFVITETGYDTISNPERQQGQYVIDTLLDATQAGATTTYLYELLDEKPDPNLTDPEQHFGLFHFDGTPKPAAIAIHTLTALLADAGASGNWIPQSLAYTVTNLPAIGQSMVFAKSDGSYDIALWAETLLGTETPTTNVTLHLPASTALAVYDLITGAIPIANYGSATDITLALGADPLIVQVTPPGSSPPVIANAVTISPATTPSATQPAVEPAPQPATIEPSVPNAEASIPATVPVTATTVYRFFDTLNGTQFLTASTAERDTIIQTRADLVSEGVGFKGAASITDPVAIYRMFDTTTGTHFYTASATEDATIAATRPDLIQEGSAFYEQASQAAGFKPVYRFFDTNNGTHFFTANANERAGILAARPDLVQEGIAFYTPT